MTTKVCAVIGIGPGNGAALATRFAQDHRVALLSRSTGFSTNLAGELANARAYACDAADAGSMTATLARVAQDMGEIDTLVYNAGSGVFANIEDLTAEDFELSWRINAAGLFNAAKAVIPAMKAKGSGSIVIIGATASKRGAPMTAAFAPAKAAQRSLAESMAKHLGPTGIHVALIIVDGMIDLPRSRSMMPDKPEDFFIQPAHVAETAHWLARQPRSAWSFEVEARPYGEKW
ncbi:MAG: SDR family NAD(P)-dependent oxidoreductase [Alphaproteobacteria bacterium]